MKPNKQQPKLRRVRGGGAKVKPRRPAPSKAPLWEALLAVAPFLDAASLAAASCVSTSWHAAFADDILWKRLCRAHYPSALGLLPLPDNGDNAGGGRHPAPHRRLFALFHAASARRRALPALRLSLADVTFTVDLFLTADGENTFSFAVAASEEGVSSSTGVFQFAVDLSGRNAVVGPEGHCRVRWTAVRTGLGLAPAAVVMMDAKVPAARAGALGSGVKGETWAMERLPAPSCGGAKLDAEVVFDVTADGEGRLIEKMRLGVMLDSRYVSLDMGLRYLQHYLL